MGPWFRAATLLCASALPLPSDRLCVDELRRFDRCHRLTVQRHHLPRRLDPPDSLRPPHTV
ncbi:hypothetical protein CRG98_031206 [Punica granatum]|uniref:Uncharacterized protein n=1 Tax=Punica granatum TaxID=22663 RepID=A0A2I0IXC8_PUNGR|nr:hypothetical protein CRG98_031206 [Punica granatum]